jgi:hypothetical protein
MSDDVNPYAATSPLIAVNAGPTGSPPTTAEFMQEVDDLVAFNFHAPFARRQLRRLWISIGAIGVFLLFCLQGLAPDVLLPLFIALVVMAVLFTPPMVRRRVRKRYARIFEHRLPRPQTVVLSSEGLFVRTPDSESCFFWRGIERIDTTPTHAFFYLLSIQAIVVPARAFQGEAQFEAFVDHARQLWTNSRAAPPSER